MNVTLPVGCRGTVIVPTNAHKSKVNGLALEKAKSSIEIGNGVSELAFFFDLESELQIKYLLSYCIRVYFAVNKIVEFRRKPQYTLLSYTEVLLIKGFLSSDHDHHLLRRDLIQYYVQHTIRSRRRLYNIPSSDNYQGLHFPV